MKNLQNLKGAKALNKKEQQSINGGGTNPCGKTGGMVVNYSYAQCVGYGLVWHNGQCWACY